MIKEVTDFFKLDPNLFIALLVKESGGQEWSRLITKYSKETGYYGVREYDPQPLGIARVGEGISLSSLPNYNSAKEKYGDLVVARHGPGNISITEGEYFRKDIQAKNPELMHFSSHYDDFERLASELNGSYRLIFVCNPEDLYSQLKFDVNSWAETGLPTMASRLGESQRSVLFSGETGEIFKISLDYNANDIEKYYAGDLRNKNSGREVGVYSNFTLRKEDLEIISGLKDGETHLLMDKSGVCAFLIEKKGTGFDVYSFHSRIEPGNMMLVQDNKRNLVRAGLYLSGMMQLFGGDAGLAYMAYNAGQKTAANLLGNGTFNNKIAGNVGSFLNIYNLLANIGFADLFFRKSNEEIMGACKDAAKPQLTAFFTETK
jgi:hypothetical protein